MSIALLPFRFVTAHGTISSAVVLLSTAMTTAMPWNRPAANLTSGLSYRNIYLYIYLDKGQILCLVKFCCSVLSS